MEIANVMVALSGDRGYTVPRYRVTPSEIAVLIAIHGEGAVFDIEPCGEVERTSRAEIERLAQDYSTARTGNDEFVVKQLFPGLGSPAIMTLEELGLPEDLYKALERVKPVAKPVAKAKGKAKADPAPAPEPAEPDDGIEDMPASALG